MHLQVISTIPQTRFPGDHCVYYDGDGGDGGDGVEGGEGVCSSDNTLPHQAGKRLLT